VTDQDPRIGAGDGSTDRERRASWSGKQSPGRVERRHTGWEQLGHDRTRLLSRPERTTASSSRRRQVAGLGRFYGVGSSGMAAELGDQPGEGVGVAGVGEDDVPIWKI
jgi:hypothetical protein